MHFICKPRAWIGALLLFAAWGWFPLWLESAERASPEKIIKEAGGIDALLQDPVANMARICVCLRGPGPSTATSRLSVLNMKADMKDPVAKSAVCYMSGEALYWTEFDRLRFGASSTNGITAAVKSRIITTYLDAWTHVSQVGTNNAHQLRQTIIGRLRTLLSTTTFGSSLPPDLKKQAVLRFVDASEQEKDGPSSWPLMQRARIYANLGIQTSLPVQLPVQMPKDVVAIRDAMMLAVALNQQTQAVRFAMALDDGHTEYLCDDLGTWYEVYKVYRDAGSPRALDCLRAIAEKQPVRFLELYDHLVKVNTNVQESTRLECLDRFLKTVVGKEPAQRAGVKAVAERMLRAGEYRKTIDFMERFYTNCETADGFGLLKVKGECLEKLGLTNEARNVYRTCIRYAEGTGSEDHVNEWCSKRLLFLGNDSDPTEKGRETQ